MRLVKGAEVYSAKGEKLGTLSRVILDPNTRKVTHLVVEKGLLFTSNKLIPIHRVNPENQEMIILRPSENETEEFDDFEEENFVSLDPTEYQQGDFSKSKSKTGGRPFWRWRLPFSTPRPRTCRSGFSFRNGTVSRSLSRKRAPAVWPVA